jgi:NAD(P)-dependent dehydrogenase (short-subunit alcohol dehydrogenase family)
VTGASSGIGRQTALDLAGSNIHVAVIHVGPIDTEMWDRAESPVPRAVIEEARRKDRR